MGNPAARNRAHGLNAPLRQEPWSRPPVAIFWDQSLVWALICLETLGKIGVPYRLLSGVDIARGALDHHRVLLVPGGWASHKVRVLGPEGRDRIEKFILEGGSYLGFCGGAGLALSSPPSLSLVPLERVPLSNRLPNASGEIYVQGVPGHPAWQGLPREIPISIWWPSQFAWHPFPSTLCLASYSRPGSDFWVADLPVCDAKDGGISWSDCEKAYGINLDPRWMIGQPAILEVRRGLGRLILSYPHLETPGDASGNQLFHNILIYLDEHAAKHKRVAEAAEPLSAHPGFSLDQRVLDILQEMEETTADLIRFGERHLLWRWRNAWLLQWRRGIRGLEYGMLAVSARVIVETARGRILRESNQTFGHCRFDQEPGYSRQTISPGGHNENSWSNWCTSVNQDVGNFCALAKRLLLEEKIASQTGNLSKLGSVNESVDRLRNQLFGSQMNHGGLCRSLLDQLDRMLLHLLRLPGQ